MADDEQDTPEVAQIRSNIESWLDRNQNNIRYDLTNSPINFNRHSDSLFTGNADHLAITLGFNNGSIGPGSSLNELRACFSFIALDRLPVPGLQGVPSKWKIHPQTPMSSFSEGVTLQEYDSHTRTLTVHVNTRFFAIYGSVPPEFPIACGRAAPGTYLQVRRDIGCDLKFKAQLVF